MAFESLLPSLEREFVNFEHGLDAVPEDVTAIEPDHLGTLQDALNETDEEITTNSHSDSITTDHNQTQLDPDYGDSTTDDSDTFSDNDLPSNMRGIFNNRKRKRNIKQALINRNKTNSPNIYSRTNNEHKTDGLYDKTKCPWQHVTAPTIRQSVFDKSFIFLSLLRAA